MPPEVDRAVDLSMEDKEGVGLYGQRIMSKAGSRLICCIVALCSWLGPVALSARHAPDPAFKALDGQTRRLSSLRGQVVVVNFWATWCGPCQEELPRLSRLAQGYAGKPVRFVLISVDEPKDRTKIPAVLGRLHVSLESWDDADTDNTKDFGLGDILPGTAILDDRGDVVARIRGEAREEDVRSAVDWLLDGRTGPAPAALTKRY
jgi:thiol-disulfide isomerase/thioredoxin